MKEFCFIIQQSFFNLLKSFKMKKISNVLTSIALLSLLFIIGCGEPKDPDDDPKPSTGSVSVSLKIVQKSTGAVIPDNKLTNWVINASLWSESSSLLKKQTFNSSVISFSNLNPANYKIAADGNVMLNGIIYTLSGGISGGQVTAGATVTGPEMIFYY